MMDELLIIDYESINWWIMDDQWIIQYGKMEDWMMIGWIDRESWMEWLIDGCLVGYNVLVINCTEATGPL